MAQLTIVRHGQTDYNKEGRYQGSIDIPLNDTGRAQAFETAIYLQHRNFDHIVASPLLRAWETGTIIAEHRGMAITASPIFVERNMGQFEGLTRSQIEQNFPGFEQHKALYQVFSGPPDGESLLEISMRVQRGLDELKDAYAGKDVLLVCHGMISKVIHGLMRRTDDEAFFNYRLQNGEADCFEW